MSIGNDASLNEKIPPSEATSQYPALLGGGEEPVWALLPSGLWSSP